MDEEKILAKARENELLKIRAEIRKEVAQKLIAEINARKKEKADDDEILNYLIESK